MRVGRWKPISRSAPGFGFSSSSSTDIDLHRFTNAVNAAGYVGDIEVEIFNTQIWGEVGDELLELVARRFLAEVV